MKDNNIKCCAPVIILNPKVIKRAYTYSLVFVKSICVSRIPEVFVLKQSDYMPKKQNVGLQDVDHCFAVDPVSGDTIPLYLVVPCGKCVICRKRKANALAARAIAETYTSGNSPLFITLTYNDFHLRRSLIGIPTLQKVDLQLFFKRLRSLLDAYKIEHHLRYLACGEYGSKTHRPHYHILLWNFPYEHEYFHNDWIKIKAFIQKAWSYFLTKEDSNSRIPMRDCCKNCPYHSYKYAFECSAANCNTGCIMRYPSGAIIYRRHPIGTIDLKIGNAGAPAYITKYMVKGSFVPKTCNPTFICSSNRGGGIGSAYVDMHKRDILSSPCIECLPVPDIQSGRIFFMPIDSFVKNRIFPSFSQSFKCKEYETIRRFYNTLYLWKYSVEQLYRLYPMDRFVDKELHYYYDTFCDMETHPNWCEAYEHIREHYEPFIQHYNIGNWMTSKELFNEYIYTLTTELDTLCEKVLAINIDKDYFCRREQYLKQRSDGFQEKYADAPSPNIEALVENITSRVKRNEWREYF